MLMRIMAQRAAESRAAIDLIRGPVENRAELFYMSGMGIPLQLVFMQGFLALMMISTIPAQTGGLVATIFLLGCGSMVLFSQWSIYRWGSQAVALHAVIAALSTLQGQAARLGKARVIAAHLAAGQQGSLYMWQWTILMRLAEGRGGAIQSWFDTLRIRPSAGGPAFNRQPE